MNKVFNIRIFAALLMFGFILSCSDDSESPFGGADVPSGEIVPIEERFFTLTGSEESSGRIQSNVNKWWKIEESYVAYNCGDQEDEDNTPSSDILVGFGPDGGFFRQGSGGSEQYVTGWSWADEEKSGIYFDVDETIVFSFTELNENAVTYASEQGEAGCKAVTWERLTSEGSSSSGDLVADFEILPTCCGPTTGTGRYLGSAEVSFENKSSNSAVRFEWSRDFSDDVWSTDENPTETFSVSTFGDMVTLTFKLTVYDILGNSASVEKSYDFPVLIASGYIIIDGEQYDLPKTLTVTGTPISYHRGFDANVGTDGADYIQINGLSAFDFNNCSPLIKLPGSAPTDLSNLVQFDETPMGNRFEFGCGSYNSDRDNFGEYSSGSVTVNVDTELDDVIDEISLTGYYVNDVTEEEIPMTVMLKHIPSTCYYDGVFCDFTKEGE